MTVLNVKMQMEKYKWKSNKQTTHNKIQHTTLVLNPI